MKKIFVFILLIGLIGGFLAFRQRLFPGWLADPLTITFNTPADDLSVYGLDTNNHTRIANIYEGLVKLDANLNVVPALAVSWGNIDETTWEFRLRENVHFHDGSPLTPQDVIDAYEAAQTSNNLQIQSYINSIESITVNSQNRLIVTTQAPDPLLLSKLSKLYINKGDEIGTGPYRVQEWVPGHQLKLEAFEDYWGQKPTYQQAIYAVDYDWVSREEGFKKGNIDILAAVPPELAAELNPNQLKTGYGLEVFFLMFDLNDPLFSPFKMRQAIASLIDPEELVLIGNGFVRPATQFIAQGVFGYNEALTPLDYSPEREARDLFGVQLMPVTLDYPSSFRTLAEYIASQLKKAGFSVTLSPNDSEAILDKLSQNQLQLYLLGWHAENGDAGNFYDSFVHSEGAFNQGGYKNEQLDAWIEASRSQMDPTERLNTLKNIAAELQKDLIGIPLFETSRIYAVQENITWEPRLDGLILASEVR